MYHVVFGLCAWWDAQTLTIPRLALLGLCFVASVGGTRGDDSTGLAVTVVDRCLPSVADPVEVTSALSGLILTYPVYRFVRRNRCGVGDSAGVYAIGARYGVVDGALIMTTGLFILTITILLRRGVSERAAGSPHRSNRRSRSGPALHRNRYPLLPALLVGDLTARVIAQVLVFGGGR